MNLNSVMFYTDQTYEGTNAIIIQKIHHDGTFECIFDIYYYPFDTQKCSVTIRMLSGNTDFIRFNQDNFIVNYFGPENLPTFGVEIHKASGNLDEENTKKSTLKVRK